MVSDTMLLTTKRKYFDSIATRWDTFGDLNQKRQRLETIVSRIALRNHEVLLDVGCGTGNLSELLLATLRPTSNIFALDLSLQMVSVAQTKLKDERITWLTCDAASTPLRASTIDAAICYSSWPHFHHAEAVAEEMFRVLKPEGMLYIIHTESRSTINSIHLHAGGAVADDVLLPANEVGMLLTRKGFRVMEATETDDLYLVAAVKSF